MTTIKIDETTRDLAVENNSLVLITDPVDEVTQRLRARLRFWRGEWFLNLTKGTPYRQEIFVKRTPSVRIENAIKREILTVPGVLELLEYSQDIDTSTRALTVSFRARATDGQIIELSEVL